MSFESVLIANRGEIACRIIRTLKELGLRSVAVYSEADRDALHVKLADDAVFIGASSASDSYLVINKIIEAAIRSGAQAVHPGYGFLSENADFAEACAKSGLIFIGPSPEAIGLMGDKAAAKRHMIASDVPVLQGYQGEMQDDATLQKEAKAMGFPLMVKAAAGGGGRGMRLVPDMSALSDSILAARAEALSAFGSDTLILERAVIRPRHVEVQVFGDRHGNIIHLGERDCSVQRRHQKVLEEAPCPVMTDELRALMGEAAVQAARSVNYVGAGTVEFLLNAAGEFFFLEMNTRLQVEHPVTEMVTGLDLVALQIRVAQGEALGLTQSDVSLRGHAIEARLYAEDPSKGFMPAMGKIAYLNFPSGVRVDSGVEAGSDVSPFYDPMIAKIIASGADRETARRKLVTALRQLALFGVQTNRQFLIDALNADDFVSGEATTAFISEVFPDENLQVHPLTSETLALAGLVHFLALRGQIMTSLPKEILGWSSAHPLPVPFEYDGQRVEITAIGLKVFKATVRDVDFMIQVQDWSAGQAQLVIDGLRKHIIWHMEKPAAVFFQMEGASCHLVNTLAMPKKRKDTAGLGDIRAPLHGALTEVCIVKGDSVEIGTRLGVVEAMKMQHDILADVSGEVTEVFAKIGTQVAANAPLFKIES